MPNTTLQPGKIARFNLRAGEEIETTCGVLWLTFESRDIVLQRGESFTAPKSGEVMAQVLGAETAQWNQKNPVCVKLPRVERLSFWRAIHSMGRHCPR